jgi:hypothetical protein
MPANNQNNFWLHLQIDGRLPISAQDKKRQIQNTNKCLAKVFGRSGCRFVVENAKKSKSYCMSRKSGYLFCDNDMHTINGLKRDR